jgi:hypothetical protein
MFSPTSRWALSWSVIFGLCQQVPVVTSSRPMDQACDLSIRIFVRALAPALLQIGGLRGASELGCRNRCPRTQTTGGGSVGHSTDGAFVECLSRALPELLGKFQQSDLVACLYEAAQAASAAR